MTVRRHVTNHFLKWFLQSLTEILKSYLLWYQYDQNKHILSPPVISQAIIKKFYGQITIKKKAFFLGSYLLYFIGLTQNESKIKSKLSEMSSASG